MITGIVILIFRILLAVALYAFLARALYTIWRDLNTQSQLVGSRQIPDLSIIRLNELDHPAQRFNSSEVMIGRDPDCELPLLNETVSGRHARLSYHHNQWWVEDMQSTNGTFLNDERVYTPIVIISGDELRCGQENLQITIQPPTA
jgi:pSer/pThr/pTyr-binding forkhead associated (FHA) protein